MPYTTDLVHELNTLIRFNLETGLVTQADGGYLTSLGREAAEYAQTMLGILTAGVAASVATP